MTVLGKKSQIAKDSTAKGYAALGSLRTSWSHLLAPDFLLGEVTNDLDFCVMESQESSSLQAKAILTTMVLLTHSEVGLRGADLELPSNSKDTEKDHLMSRK